VIIGLAGFAVVLGMRLGPIYMQNYEVNNVLHEVAAEDNIGRAPEQVIWGKLSKFFDINNIDNIKQDDFKVQHKDGQTTFTLHYETRLNLVGNLDGVVVFNKTVVANQR
jgi:hypothetical protein